MSGSKRMYFRGAAAERALIALLRRNGWFAVRAPRSGKGYGVDVIAIRDGKAIFFEVKRRRDFTKIQIPREQYEAALEIAKQAGAPYYLALNVTSYHIWYVRPISDPDSISSSTVSYKPNEKWILFQKLLVNFSNQQNITINLPSNNENG